MAFFDFLRDFNGEKQAIGKGFNFLKNIGVSAVHDVKNAADVINAGVQGVAGLGSIAGAAITHNQAAEQNAIRRTNAAIDYSLNASRGAYTPQEARSNNIGERLIKPGVRNVATYLPYAFAPGASDIVAPEAATATKLLASGRINAAVGGGTNVASQIVNTGKVDPVEALKAAAASGVIGTVAEGGNQFLAHRVPVAGNEIGSVGKDVTGGAAERPVVAGLTNPDLIKLAKVQTPSEVKTALKDKVPANVVDQVAPAIAKTKDPNIVASIIDKATTPTQARAGLDVLRGVAKDSATPEEFAAKVQALPETPELRKAVDNLHPDVATPEGLYGALTGKEVPKAPTAELSRPPETQPPALAETTPPPVSTPVEATTPPVGQGSAVGKNVGGEVIPPRTNDPVQNVVEALKGQPAGKGQTSVAGLDNLLGKQKELYSQARKANLRNAYAAGSDLTGREALYAQKSALQGELPRVDSKALIEHLNSKVSKEDVNGILDSLRNNPNLRGYDSITAQGAVVKLFDEGKIPTPKEWKLLQDHLGTDFTDSVATAATDSLTGVQKVKNFAVQVLGMPKAIMASYDLSGGGRQGAFLGTRYPQIWAQAQKDSVKAFASESFYKDQLKAMEDLTKNGPRKEIYDKMKLDLTALGGHEEAFPNQLAEKIPVAGRGIAASDRAYTLGLNEQRLGTAEHILDQLDQAGQLKNLTEKDLHSLGEYINTATGRGSLGPLEKHATSLGEALFSPRLWASRLQMLNPVYYAKLSGPARKLALQNAATFAGVAASVLGLAAAAGAKVETDARSSDFLKIKVGDTRYDILGGFQQNLVFAWREITGQKKSSITGKVTDLNSGKFGAASRLSVLGDLIQNKENPVFSAGQRIIRGTDIAGNPVNPVTEVGKLFVPLPFQDTYAAVKNTGSLAKGIAKSLPGEVGIGVGTYGIKDITPSGTNQKYIDYLKKNGAPPERLDATKNFYQYLQTGPDKQKASDDINKAIGAGDIQKATQIANDFNKQYATHFKEWVDKYGKYGKDQQLVKDYNSGKISLTNTNIRSRKKKLKGNIYAATTGGL